MTGSYRDLRVWQDAMQLVVAIYKATTKFPKEEMYGLTSQIRRAAVSIPSNIAEGKGHRTDREFCQFLYHARGSTLELQTQLTIARELEYMPETEAKALLERCDILARKINALINSLSIKAKGAGA